MKSGLTSHHQQGHTETGPLFKVLSEGPEKRGIDLATPGLVAQRVISYTLVASHQVECLSCRFVSVSVAELLFSVFLQNLHLKTRNWYRKL